MKCKLQGMCNKCANQGAKKVGTSEGNQFHQKSQL